jgi:beta-1,4-mannosyl-glycoprotein beta-1,4-N-acetylglucosaminyltransferase
MNSAVNSDVVDTSSALASDKKSKLVDCFTFYNELAILEARLRELEPIVDHWVLVESTKTHAGNDKTLYFADNKERFRTWADRITHIIVDDMPNEPGIDSWVRENFQRNAISRGLDLLKLDDQDIVMISDVDEIPSLTAVTSLVDRKLNGLHSLSQRLFYYNFSCENRNCWWGTILSPYSVVKRTSPQQLRDMRGQGTQVLKGGWHCSYFGDENFIRNKLQNFAHQEFNSEQFTNLEIIKRRIAQGQDLFGRTSEQWLYREPSEQSDLPYYAYLIDSRYQNPVPNK